MRSIVSLAFALGALVSGCSDGGSRSSAGNDGGTIGPGTGGTLTDHCYFRGTLSGGVSGAIDANGCGTSGDSVFSIAQADLASGKSLGIRVELTGPLKGGETGVLSLKKLVVFEKRGKDAAQLTWESTGCGVELTKSEHSPTTVFKNRYLLSGKGTCPAPLAPAAGNDKAAVEITPFEFGAFVNPD
jgi:hypothetical protein